METMYINHEHTLFSTEKNTEFDHGMKKYTNIILSNTTDETISNLKNLSLTIPSTEVNFNSNKYFSVFSDPAVCKNGTSKFESNTSTDKIDTSNLCPIFNSCKPKIKTIDVMIDQKKIGHPKTTNKKQKNLSFSNKTLWEINRVNRILHNKISNGVKPTYSRQKPSTFFKRATSTINRERKHKDIEKGNEVSFINIRKNKFILKEMIR